MSDLTTIIFSSIGTTGVVSVAAVFILKEYFTNKIRMDVERRYKMEHETFSQKLISDNALRLEQFKSQLTSETTKEGEHLKSTLAIAAMQRQFQYSQVFERTVKALEDVYKRLFLLQVASNEFSEHSTDKPVDKPTFGAERLKIYNTLDEFRMFYVPLRIYLSKNTNKMIDDYTSSIYSMIHHLNTANLVHNTTSSNIEFGEQSLNRGLEDWEQLAELMENLESEFRTILGFPTDETPQATTSPIDVPKILSGHHEQKTRHG